LKIHCWAKKQIARGAVCCSPRDFNAKIDVVHKTYLNKSLQNGTNDGFKRTIILEIGRDSKATEDVIRLAEPRPPVVVPHDYRESAVQYINGVET
jgi:hypothetical protein